MDPSFNAQDEAVPPGRDEKIASDLSPGWGTRGRRYYTSRQEKAEEDKAFFPLQHRIRSQKKAPVFTIVFHLRSWERRSIETEVP